MDKVFLISEIFVSIAIFIALIGMMRGPTVVDRILAFDLAAVSLVAFTALLSIRWETPYYLELILIISSLGFFGAVALVHYLMKTIPDPEEDEPVVDRSKEEKSS